MKQKGKDKQQNLNVAHGTQSKDISRRSFVEKTGKVVVLGMLAHFTMASVHAGTSGDENLDCFGTPGQGCPLCQTLGCQQACNAECHLSCNIGCDVICDTAGCQITNCELGGVEP